MREIHFADGFDVSEPLALGLTHGQLVVAVAGLLAGYADLRSGLPRVLAIAVAVLLGSATLALAVLRRDGRPLVEWATVALRFAVAPRRGTLLRTDSTASVAAAIAMPGPSSYIAATDRQAPPTRLKPAGDAPPAGLEIARRMPLVLLPQPRLPEPRGSSSVRAVAQASAHEGQAVAPVASAATRLVTFFSLRGGTGRTTLATEVAALLAASRSDRSEVALLDLDEASPAVGLRLGLSQPSVAGWLQGGASPSQLDRHLLRHRCGLRVLLGPSQPTILDGPRLEPAHVAAMVAELERLGTRLIVFDIAAGLGAVNRWVLDAAHDVFVVLTPTAGGVLDAYRCTEVLRRLGLRHKLHYLVNRSRGMLDLGETMGDLGGRVEAEISDDPGLEDAENQHRLAGGDEDRPAAAGLRQVAGVIRPGRTSAIEPFAGTPPGLPDDDCEPHSRGWRRRAV